VINRSRSVISSFKTYQKQAIERENSKLASRILYVKSNLEKDKIISETNINLEYKKVLKKPP